MSNYVIQVDFFGNSVRAETEGHLISLTDLVKAGNMWRINNNMSPKTLQTILDSAGFKEFIEIAKKDMPEKDIMFTVGKGNQRRTMAHIIVAVFVAEQMSPEFHYKVIKTFVENKILEFRELGGTEFKSLNVAIDLYLKGREGKDNKGIYITIAKAIRKKLMGVDSDAGCWDSATVPQIHSRYDMEKELISFLKRGLINDWEHLKEVIDRM